MSNESTFLHRLDTLLEGIQVIDRNWRYIYVNDVIPSQAFPREEMIGATIMEKFPDIQGTELFESMKTSMNDRVTLHFETLIKHPLGVERWFQICIQPAEEGICILSLDITASKISQERLEKSKTLYAFLSQVNQSIVHSENESQLYKSACEIAVEYGKFKMAWIGLFASDNEIINLVEHCGISDEGLSVFHSLQHFGESSMRHVLKINGIYICNDITKDFTNPDVLDFALNNDIKSFSVLPLRLNGKIIGTFNLYSEKVNAIDTEELGFLDEIISDLSFALSHFEKERRHRKTEQTVYENEKRFRAIIEKSADVKILTSAEGILLYASPSLEATLGYPQELLSNQNFFKFFHPEDLENLNERMEEFMINPGSSIYFEARMRHSDEIWIWCQGISTNMLEESGIHAIVTNFRDISDKKASEQQMEFEQKNTTALINNTSDLMWSIDEAMNLITFNQPFSTHVTSLYGTPTNTGDYIFRPEISAASKELFIEFYKRALNGETFRETIQLSSKEVKWSETTFSPISKNNKVIGVACHSRDITERINSEIELENRNKELIKTNFELDRFVYSVSHDLRSPLTSIIGLLTFIEEESKEKSTLAHTAMIKTSINRLDGFIKNILNYSRTNRAEIEYSRIPMTETANGIVESLRHMLETDNIRFEVEFVEKFPFVSDPLGFKTILENLISNAIKFHRYDQANCFIKISGKSDADYLQMTISDNGCGIPESQHNKIFDMFFRSSAKIDGSGIGLYIVKEIISKLKGSIEVESEPGKGSSFHIRLKNQKDE